MSKRAQVIDSCEDIAVTYDVHWLKLWEKRFGDPLRDAETFRFNQNKMLTEIGNRPDFVGDVKGQYMGLIRFSPKGWEEVISVCSDLSSSEIDRIAMTGMLQKIIDRGRVAIGAVPYAQDWGEVDSIEDLAVY